ncbi:MAG: PAS domain S-box protein [bacterium]
MTAFFTNPLYGFFFFCGLAFVFAATIVCILKRRSRAVSEIIKSLEWKNAIFENSSGGIFILNEKRIIVEANVRASEMFGYLPQEIIGQSTAMLYISMEAFQEFRVSYEAIARGEIVHGEREMLRKDGAHFWCELSGKAIDPAHLNRGIVWTLFDITARKHAEEKLKESLRTKSLLQDIINRSPVAVFVWEAKENWPVEYVSGRTKEIFGYSPEDFLQGKISYASVIHPDDLYRVASEAANYDKQNTKEFSQEYRIIMRQKEIKWIDERTYVWRDEKGIVTRHQSIIVDITERKLAEEERIKMSKLQSIELLAAGVAHDLNNILTSLSANVQLAVLEHEMGKNVTERLQSADDACDRAAQLASQLLSFSKPNAPAVKTADIGELVKAVVRFSLHGSKSVADISVPKGQWLSNVDENQVGQVVNNIVLNATQAMPRGGKVMVRVSNYKWEAEDKLDAPPGAYIRITIADEGVGMSPECRNRIFDPYFTTKQAGSGLGLTTAYSIIKRHGGTITVDSELGRGSCFSIYLPALPPNTPLASGAAQVKREPKLRGSLRALFMDDDPYVRVSVRNLFTLMGYQVNVAANGEEALAMFKQARKEGQPYHFVMLDLTIPGGMGGKTTVRHLQEIDPQVIAIVVSGYTDDPVMLNCQEHGFRAALSKPLRIQAVKEVLVQIEAEVGKGKRKA